MIESAEEFVRLRSSTEPDLYHRAAHETAHDTVWRDVITHFPDMRFWVAQNKTVPIAILQLLAKDRDPKVRTMVARKRKIGPDILRLLAADEDDAVRMSVARHPKTPLDVLQALARDSWSEIADVAQSCLSEGR